MASWSAAREPANIWHATLRCSPPLSDPSPLPLGILQEPPVDLVALAARPAVDEDHRTRRLVARHLVTVGLDKGADDDSVQPSYRLWLEMACRSCSSSATCRP